MGADSPVCPATMCPLMGAQEEGSPWTGERDADCESDCGWYRDDSCIVAGDLVGMILEDYPEDEQLPDVDDCVDCVHADSCKWQQQMGDTPCPPRLAVALNQDPERCLF